MKKLTSKEKDLTRRYLIWCYKTTKEDIDRIDRYYTQIPVDKFMLAELKKSRDYKSSKSSKEYRNIVGDFEKYIAVKKKNVDSKKFKDSNCRTLDPEYVYLKARFSSIEKAIVAFLGKNELKKIRDLYEKEMTERILSARQHT